MDQFQISEKLQLEHFIDKFYHEIFFLVTLLPFV